MVSVIHDNLDKIRAACWKMGVKSLFLTGFAARSDDSKNSSGLDFVYSFTKDENGWPLTGFDYFDLRFILAESTGKKIKNRFFSSKVQSVKSLYP